MLKPTLKLRRYFTLLTASTFALCSLTACTEQTAQLQPVAQETATAQADPYGDIPGPRDCFWARGPHGADPYINVAYPDANVFYWAADLDCVYSL